MILKNADTHRHTSDRTAWACRAGLMVLAAVLLGHGFWQEYKQTDGQWGAPLDDTYIHLQYARQLAEGHGLAFNTGDRTPGSTCPLWTLSLAALCALGGGGVLAAKICSAVLLGPLVLLAFAVGRRVLANNAWSTVFGAAVAVSGRLNWAALSGMEPILASLLVLLALWLVVQPRQPVGRLLAAGALGLATLARPEAAVLFAVFWLLQAGQACRGARTAAGRAWTVMARQLLVFGAFVAPYVIYCQWAYGHPVPATYYAKQHHPTWLPNARFLKLYLGHLFLDQPMLVALVPMGVLGALGRSRRSGDRLLAAWVLAYPLLASLNQPNAGQHGRYAMFMIAPHLLLAVMTLAALVPSKSSGARWRRLWPSVRAGYAVAALLVGAGLTVWWQVRSGQHVHEINRMHVHLGRWINSHTEPDALIAANDVGAIAYFGRRRIIDTCGLVTGEGAPFRRQLRLPEQMQRQLLDYLSRRRPDYAVLFPAWYAWMVGHESMFEEIYAVRLERAEVAAQPTMVVYRCRWPTDKLDDS